MEEEKRMDAKHFYTKCGKADCALSTYLTQLEANFSESESVAIIGQSAH